MIVQCEELDVRHWAAYGTGAQQLLPAITEPLLLDEAVGHAGDVVGYGAGEAFGGNLRLVIKGQERGLCSKGCEEILNDAGGAFVLLFHPWGVIEVGIEIALGGGAVGFHGGAEYGDACGCAANVIKRCGVEESHTTANLFDQIGDEGVEHAVEGLVNGLLWRRRGVLCRHFVMKAAEERDMPADFCDGEDAGVEAVVEVGGEVGDLVSEVNQLRFEGRAEVEEICCEFGMSSARVIARVFDDAFTDGEREVETAPGWIAFFKPGDDA